jgi:phosphate starvation-inducible PhoH-like protein
VDGISHRLRAEGRLTVPDVVLAVQQQGREAAAGSRHHRATEGASPGRTSDGPVVPTKKLLLTPKTDAQRAYIDALKKNEIVLGIGPAGTGKTYLAMGMAVAALLNREVSRIVLTRPAVEAGEHLGFLPGDLYAKVNPFVRPLYDALYDMMEVEQANRLVERGEIEIVPLAYMRGRTLNDAFIILDEAQNTTPEQMKMFLTRIGFGTKAVITGDVTQIDLARGQKSGLVDAREVLWEVRGIAFTSFTSEDVVRHPLVARIVTAYEAHTKRTSNDGPAKGA